MFLTNYAVNKATEAGTGKPGGAGMPDDQEESDEEDEKASAAAVASARGGAAAGAAGSVMRSGGADADDDAGGGSDSGGSDTGGSSDEDGDDDGAVASSSGAAARPKASSSKKAAAASSKAPGAPHGPPIVGANVPGEQRRGCLCATAAHVRLPRRRHMVFTVRSMQVASVGRPCRLEASCATWCVVLDPWLLLLPVAALDPAVIQPLACLTTRNHACYCLPPSLRPHCYCCIVQVRGRVGCKWSLDELLCALEEQGVFDEAFHPAAALALLCRRVSLTFHCRAHHCRHRLRPPLAPHQRRHYEDDAGCTAIHGPEVSRRTPRRQEGGAATNACRAKKACRAVAHRHEPPLQQQQPNIGIASSSRGRRHFGSG